MVAIPLANDELFDAELTAFVRGQHDCRQRSGCSGLVYPSRQISHSKVELVWGLSDCQTLSLPVLASQSASKIGLDANIELVQAAISSTFAPMRLSMTADAERPDRFHGILRLFKSFLGGRRPEAARLGLRR